MSHQEREFCGTRDSGLWFTHAPGMSIRHSPTGARSPGSETVEKSCAKTGGHRIPEIECPWFKTPQRPAHKASHQKLSVRSFFVDSAKIGNPGRSLHQGWHSGMTYLCMGAFVNALDIILCHGHRRCSCSLCCSFRS